MWSDLTFFFPRDQAFRDPGILPRHLDPEPPYPPIGSEDNLRAPLPRDLKVRAGV